MVSVDKREDFTGSCGGFPVTRLAHPKPRAFQDVSTCRTRDRPRPMIRAVINDDDLTVGDERAVGVQALQTPLEASLVVANGDDETDALRFRHCEIRTWKHAVFELNQRSTHEKAIRGPLGPWPQLIDSECVKQYWPQKLGCRRWKSGYPETKTALTADRRPNGGPSPGRSSQQGMGRARRFCVRAPGSGA